MFRYIPLLFLFFACSSDPLFLHEENVAGPESPDGLMEADLTLAAPVTGRQEIIGSHEDLTLRLSFRMDAGAKADLMVQGKYPIELPSMAIAGAVPRIQTKINPGYWQDLEVVFISEKNGEPAIYPAVYLNGTLVHYQVPAVAAEGAQAGPLSLDVRSGKFELADVRYSNQGGKQSLINDKGDIVLNMPAIEYKLYDLPQGAVDVEDWGKLSVKKTGYINRFDLGAIRETGSRYAIRFAGQLDIPRAGAYSFTSSSPSSVQVYIDGQRIIDQSGKHPYIHTKGDVELEEGPHTVEVEYAQSGSWGNFQLAYKTPAGNTGRLNSMGGKEAIATAGASTPQVLATDAVPYLLRSFLYFPAPKVYETAAKRTHVLSVGEGEGPHYSVDLKNGALLQAWRGAFADTYEMWVGRGEPQVMRPLGVALYFDESPQWAELSSAKDPWPEGMAAAEDFHHYRHSLDEAGRPTFEYGMNGHSLTDKLTPTPGGLLRELTHNVGGNGTLFTKLAAARQIVETAPGTYELRGPGLKLAVKSYDGDQLILQHKPGKDLLLAELPAKGHLTYSMEW